MSGKDKGTSEAQQALAGLHAAFRLAAGSEEATVDFGAAEDVLDTGLTLAGGFDAECSDTYARAIGYIRNSILFAERTDERERQLGKAQEMIAKLRDRLGMAE